ncbi:ABC transporter substrate-binding protein [Stigmatella sp. ncwal1]|uniref:ABC transporter substrate-binding protein n=1 Tax=Stigmatella ashevillensis TaxID=2995309 RepID=A0ABT5DJ92_9BACT|nr:ABC transporter substrate-binding protein [Stigmatella ashevillena]MDC0713139.1 ABC transporter substrate-binding protein [Stigmatella ashevillena]
MTSLRNLQMVALASLMVGTVPASALAQAKPPAQAPAPAQPPAQMTDKVIKIGVLNDQSGLYADLSGKGSVLAAKMAVEDFGGQVGGTPVEVIFADHQNKPDIGSNVARQWLDVDKVDVIVDVPTSSVALAVSEIAKTKNKVFLDSGAGSIDLTGKACTPNTVHWTYDTYALAHGTGSAVVANGGSSWFFLTADYAFGHALEKDVSDVVKASGGKVLGAVRHPLNTADFSSFLLQAQSSGAKVIGLANAGGDTINAIKAASEFGITEGGQKLAGLLVFISDVHALGLPSAKGLQLTSAFYWDTNDQTRAFSKRFSERNGGKVPTMVHAGVYSSVLHYLKAVQALKSDADGKAVVAQMKAMPTEDPLFGKGSIRADGRKIHPMYLYEVKAPSESKKPWDYYKLVRTIPAEQAFRPLAQSECPLVKK